MKQMSKAIKKVSLPQNFQPCEYNNDRSVGPNVTVKMKKSRSLCKIKLATLWYL